MFEVGQARTFFLSLIPGVFWIAYVRSLSSGRETAWWKWVIALVAGWASTKLTLAVSAALGVDILRAIPVIGLFVFFVVGVGLLEECAKAVCALMAIKLPGFADRPLTALQLSCGVALGFATTENLIYAQSYGDSVIVFRFLSATLGHLLFSSIWGFALGSQIVICRKSGLKLKKTPWKSFVGMVFLSGLAHGLYDWFLVSERPAFAILLVIVLWAGFRETALSAYLSQEYRRDVPYDVAPCPKCSVLTRSEGNYCSFCGGRITEPVPLVQ